MKNDSPLKDIIREVEAIKIYREDKQNEFPLELMDKIDDLTTDFEDEFKLRNLPSPILTSLCKIHLLPTFLWMFNILPRSLKIQFLKRHLGQLRKDDAVRKKNLS